MHFRVRWAPESWRVPTRFVVSRVRAYQVIFCDFSLEFALLDKMAEPEHEQAKQETFASFAYLISPLILRALADLGFSRPTRVQQQAIPLALENRDVLARAPTGSGKTAAYCIPLLQKLLNAKAVGTLHWRPSSHPPVSLLFFYRILH